MSNFKTARENLTESARRLYVGGSPSTGKTTFSVSISEHAGQTITGPHRLCKDVAVLSGDPEGISGALNVGLEPGIVSDYTACATWPDFKKRLVQDINELLPLVKSGEIKHVIVDIGLLDRLVRDHVKPSDVAGWGRVGVESAEVYKVLGALRGATIIANFHLTAAQGAVEAQSAVDAGDAKSVGGERATFKLAVASSIASPWTNDANFGLARSAKKIAKDIKNPAAGQTLQFFTHVHPSSRFPVKNRFVNNFPTPTEPGERTLHSILVQAYGVKK